MNPAIVAVGGSVIRSLNARKKASSIDLGLGEPTLAPEIAHFERATRWVAQRGCRYTAANAGDPELRAAIGAHYRYPGMARAENVCVTTGSQEALYVVIKALLDPAVDELLIVEPAFPAYEKIARIEGVSVRSVSMPEETGFAFEPERVMEALTPRTRAILICSPCNPSGRVISSGAVRRIAKLLGERGGAPVYVIHDEIYRELCYTTDLGSFGERYPYTIAINSLSKSNALTGLRIGWFTAPTETMGELVKAHAVLTSCASTFGQRVAYEIFAAGELGVHRAWYERRREESVLAAKEAGLPCVEPEGAFYLCVKTGIADDVAFAHELLERRDVVAIPGSIFGDVLRGWLRLSFVGDAQAFAEGCRRIADALTAAGAA